MCWNKEVSFITFLVGTACNYLLIKAYPVTTIYITAIYWQLILSMQIFEGLSWVAKDLKNKALDLFSSKSAFLFNISQPVLLAAMVGFTQPLSVQTNLALLCSFYLFFIVKGSWNKTFKPLHSTSCTHLQLYWWKEWFSDMHKQIRYSIAFVLYNVISFCSFLFLPKVGYFIVLWFFFTMTLSKVLYYCSYGGTWCWFAALSPLATLVFLKARKITELDFLQEEEIRLKNI